MAQIPGDYLKIRRGIIDDAKFGRLSGSPYLIYLHLIFTADPLTGVVWGVSSEDVGKRLGIKAVTVKRAFQRLEISGYIKRFYTQGRRGGYPILIDRYVTVSDLTVMADKSQDVDHIAYNNTPTDSPGPSPAQPSEPMKATIHQPAQEPGKAGNPDPTGNIAVELTQAGLTREDALKVVQSYGIDYVREKLKYAKEKIAQNVGAMTFPGQFILSVIEGRWADPDDQAAQSMKIVEDQKAVDIKAKQFEIVQQLRAGQVIDALHFALLDDNDKRQLEAYKGQGGQYLYRIPAVRRAQ